MPIGDILLAAFLAALLTNVLLYVIFGAKRSDTITVNIPAITLQIAAPPLLTEVPESTVPISNEVLEYIDLESDEWARAARRTRARTLFNDVQNWESVLNMLKREDA